MPKSACLMTISSELLPMSFSTFEKLLLPVGHIGEAAGNRVAHFLPRSGHAIGTRLRQFREACRTVPGPPQQRGIYPRRGLSLSSLICEVDLPKSAICFFRSAVKFWTSAEHPRPGPCATPPKRSGSVIESALAAVIEFIRLSRAVRSSVNLLRERGAGQPTPLRSNRAACPVDGR